MPVDHALCHAKTSEDPGPNHLLPSNRRSSAPSFPSKRVKGTHHRYALILDTGRSSPLFRRLQSAQMDQSQATLRRRRHETPFQADMHRPDLAQVSFPFQERVQARTELHSCCWQVWLLLTSYT